MPRLDSVKVHINTTLTCRASLRNWLLYPDQVWMQWQRETVSDGKREREKVRINIFNSIWKWPSLVPTSYWNLFAFIFTMEALLKFKGSSCGICGGKNGDGTSFAKIFLFPLPITIPPKFHYHLSFETGTAGPFEAAAPRDCINPLLQLGKYVKVHGVHWRNLYGAGITKVILKAMIDYFLKFGLQLIASHGTNKKAATINFHFKESL